MNFAVLFPGKTALWATGVILLALFSLMLVFSEGTFVYLQDDAYIHLAIARNVADHGVWGITPYAFASASSSPLWILLLSAAFALLGKTALYFPLVLNVALVLLIVALMERILRSFSITGARALGVIGVVALATPLGPFAFSGMEHAFHIATVLAFIYFLSSHLKNEDGDGKALNLMLLMAPLVTGLRYEGVFVIAAACGLLLLRKRYRDFFFVAALGAAPLIAFGIWSLSQGGNFVPNTLLVKKKLATDIWESGKALLQSAYFNAKMPIFFMFLTSLLLALHRRLRLGTLWQRDATALALIAAAFALQAIFGRFSFVAMFRYEAFLVLTGLLYIFISLRDIDIGTFYERKRWLSPLNIIFLILLVLFSLPLLRRTVAWPYAVLTAKNIYEQPYQAGQFFKTYYKDQVIGATDIGAISYYGEVRTIDFWGLADTETMEARRDGNYEQKELRAIADKRGMRAAALFDSWYGASIPADWIKVVTWTIRRNVAAGSPILSFYAPNCAEASTLEKNMRDFAASALPSAVEVAYFEVPPICALSSQRR